jgi:hypothetical protein
VRPIDHFYSAVQRREASFRSENKPGETAGRLHDEFVSLVGPVIGPEAAGAFFYRAVERCIWPAGAPLSTLGAAAAFFLGEYDDTLPLGGADWDDIRETLEEAAAEMDMNTLTALMDELLRRGLLLGKR